MIEILRDEIKDWVNTLGLGVTAQSMYVPVLDRKDINDTTIIVSAASRNPVRRTRSKLDASVIVDIAIAHPCETDSDAACGIVLDAAEAIIDAGFDLATASGKAIDIEQPIVIDQDYFRQQNIALSVVRITARSY